MAKGRSKGSAGQEPPREAPSSATEPISQGVRSEMAREIQDIANALQQMAATSNPLAATLTPQQIDRLFDLLDKQSQRQSSERTRSRMCLILAFAALLLTLCFLWATALFSSHPELASDLIKMIGGLIGGLLGGYGLKGVTQRKQRP